MMNNEPVAWILTDRVVSSVPIEGAIPLYTHPAKILTEPSVKEIEDLWLDVINNISANDHRPREWHFAKAILRKAQE
jgi:hypothetical protein